MSPALKKIISNSNIPEESKIKVAVTVNFQNVKRNVPNLMIAAYIDRNGKDTVLDQNKKKLTKADIEKLHQSIIKESQTYVSRKKASIIKALKKFQSANKMYAKNISEAIRKGRNTFIMDIKKNRLEGFLKKNKEHIVVLDIPRRLHSKSLTSAMQSTKVDPYAFDNGSDGDGINIYMEDMNCPNPVNITGTYTRISGDCPTDVHASYYCEHTTNVVSIARAVSPHSHIYCKQNNGDFGPNNRSNINIESYSIGVNAPYVDSTYKAMDRDLDNEAYDYNIPVFASAGNHRKDYDNSWYVASPAKGFNTITVGNYKDYTNEINKDEDGSAYIEPETHTIKPELSAPGTFINAGGVTMTGTSQATPHAAAFAADLMESYSWLKDSPTLIKALLLSGATKELGGNDYTVFEAGNKTGVGGLNFYNSYYYHWNWWFEGDYNYVASTFDKQFGGTDDSTIDLNYYLSAGTNVRAVLTWLNNGDYTLQHKYIGKDYDLRVYKPDGSYLAEQESGTNSSEVVNFTAPVSGNYKFVIIEYANYDTNSPMKLALSVNPQ